MRIGEGDQPDVFNTTQKRQNTGVHLNESNRRRPVEDRYVTLDDISGNQKNDGEACLP